MAYARQLHDQSDLPAGGFETQFTFAQALTESAKLAGNCLLVISAEVGLKLHHRISALARDALDTAHEQALQTFGQERAAEELLRLPVLVRTLPQVDLPEIGGELRLLVAAARDIGVWRDHFAPRLEG